ncbi:MAG: hypothetical protein EBW04_06510 [Betaproteobacteria bacterium]|nr:hypothetical protein [Betaproteobacteria bacterium]
MWWHYIVVIHFIQFSNVFRAEPPINSGYHFGSRLVIKDNFLFITFSKNSFASKFKISKKEILDKLNLIQNKIAFTNIYSKVDPSIIKTEEKTPAKNKLSKKAEKIWANLYKNLDDSPLKEYFSKKND